MGIVYKEYKAGERVLQPKKDLDELAVKIARERSKEEIKPPLKILKKFHLLSKSNRRRKTFC
jgi:hypothetical protein